jgi:hypothetical protein
VGPFWVSAFPSRGGEGACRTASTPSTALRTTNYAHGIYPRVAMDHHTLRPRTPSTPRLTRLAPSQVLQRLELVASLCTSVVYESEDEDADTSAVPSPGWVHRAATGVRQSSLAAAVDPPFSGKDLKRQQLEGLDPVNTLVLRTVLTERLQQVPSLPTPWSCTTAPSYCVSPNCVSPLCLPRASPLCSPTVSHHYTLLRDVRHWHLPRRGWDPAVRLLTPPPACAGAHRVRRRPVPGGGGVSGCVNLEAVARLHTTCGYCSIEGGRGGVRA